jgi:hypothetical protein
MTTGDHLRMALVLYRRLVEVFVIFPSAGMAVLFLTVAGTFGSGSPLHAAVAITYAWADGAFRNAPAGQVFVSVPPPPRTGERPKLLASEADPLEIKPVPISQAVDEMAAGLAWIYGAFVLAGGVILLMALGPRRLVGWPRKSGLDGTTARSGGSEGHRHG